MLNCQHKELWEAGELLNLVVHQPTRNLIIKSSTTPYEEGWNTFLVQTPNLETQIQYISKIFDLGKVGEVLITSPTETKIDNLDWTETPQSALKARYVQFKLDSLPPLNLISTIEPIRHEEYGINTNVPINGLTINFEHIYFNNPVIVVTNVGSTFALPTITQQSDTNFNLKLLNTSGNSISGKVNFYVAGY